MKIPSSRDEELVSPIAMEPARIALQRRISSDSIDSFGVGPNPRVVRKGKRRGPKKFAKTKVENIKGDDLRSPQSPVSGGIRHSDRIPEKRLRVLRDDITGSGIQRKKSLRQSRPSRRTRSLSPQTLDRQKASNDLLNWKPMDLLNVAEHAGIAHSRHEMQRNEEGDESSLGSLIDAIEADFGGERDMSNFHQSVPCMSTVPLCAEDDPDYENSLRFSPDADVLLSLASGKCRKSASKSTKNARKTSIGKDSNNASMGTLVTENSTLSTSFEDAVIDLFSNLKPQPDPPSTLNPPSQHERKDPPKQGKKSLDSPKKKSIARQKEPTSVTSNDSQWLELVLPLNPKNAAADQSTVGQSTVGDVKAYKSDASGAINSMNSDEVHEKIKEGSLMKSLSALDVQDLVTPTKKKDFLRATTHCSPTQVSKHTGLSSLSAHTGTNSSGRSNSSAYLLERLPLNPPAACDDGETPAKKNKKTPATKRTAKKGSDLSLESNDQSVEVFQGTDPKSEKQPAPLTAKEPLDGKEPAPTASRSPRRGRRPGKNDADGPKREAPQTPHNPVVKERTQNKASDATLESVEIFSPAMEAKPASDEVSAAGDTVSSDTTGPTPCSDVTTAGFTMPSALFGSSPAQHSKSKPIDEKNPTVPVSEGGYSEDTTNISSSTPRKNPPARPWSGRNSFADGSLASSIKELAEGQIEEESMLNVLITSLKKDQYAATESDPVERNGNADQNEEEVVRTPADGNIDRRSESEKNSSACRKDKKMDTAKLAKSPKTAKKQSRKLKSARSPKSSSGENGPADLTEVTEQSPSPRRTPQSHKSQKSHRKSIDTSEISAPPLTTPPGKTPVCLVTEDNPPRRRIRSRKTGAVPEDVTLSKGKRSPARVRPVVGDSNASGKKTPTRGRPSTEGPVAHDGAVSNGKKTPTRMRPGVEDLTVPRKKTPTRPRPGTQEEKAAGRKKTPTRVRPMAENRAASNENRTPTRVRPRLTEGGNAPGTNRTPTRTRGRLDGGGASVGRRTPTRVRPGVDNGNSTVRRKTPSRSRTRLDCMSDAEGKKTPTRLRPGLDVSKEAPTWVIHGFQDKNNDIDRPITPVKGRVPAQPELPRRIQSPIRTYVKLTDGTDLSGDATDDSNPVADREPRAPDPPAATHGLDQPTPDPSVVTPDAGGGHRHSTPTRVRRFFDAAAERVASACRTPPKERVDAAQSPGREGRPMRQRSFSPFSRLRMLGSRTPPRERRIGEPEHNSRTRTPTRRVLSQSPPKERPAQNVPDADASAPERPKIDEPPTGSLVSLTERPTSRGRRRSSSSVSRKSEESAETAASQIRQNSIGSQNSLASRTKTLLPKRKIGIDKSLGSSDTDVKSTRTKTPTRVRRSRGSQAEGESKKDVKPGQQSGQVAIRPRRRGVVAGTERDSLSSVEKPTLATASTSSGDNLRKIRRRTPTRGRQSARGQTPTKSRKARPTVTRGSSERGMRAPDPPGVNRSNERSLSAGRAGRSNSQPRPRRAEHRVLPISSQSSHVGAHPLADFFD